MTIVPGIVVDGRVEVEDFDLPEGAKVGVVITARDRDQAYVPTEEEVAGIEAGLDELERGESVTLDEMMHELRVLRVAEERKRS